MLLKNFGFGKKKNPKIHVFDKHRGDFGGALPHPTSVRNIAAEKGFYDFEISEYTVSIENTLTEIEDRTTRAFQTLFDKRDLKALSVEETAWISIFVALQRVRSRHFRESIKQIDEGLAELILKTGSDPNDVEGWRPFKNENEVKTFSSMFAIKSSKKLSEAICSKAWILLETGPDTPFWIGDNPVALHNDDDFRPRGNLGLSVPGIQIYLPLSPNLTLGMWCPEMVKKVLEEIDMAKNALNTAKMSRVMMPSVNRQELDVLIERAESRLEYSEQLGQGLEKGTPVPCIPEIVTFMNSLQVGWAYRFIMSNKHDFALAEKMMKESPDLKTGHYSMKMN